MVLTPEERLIELARSADAYGYGLDKDMNYYGYGPMSDEVENVGEGVMVGGRKKRKLKGGIPVGGKAPTAYNIFFGEKRKCGYTAKEIGQMWRETKSCSKGGSKKNVCKTKSKKPKKKTISRAELAKENFSPWVKCLKDNKGEYASCKEKYLKKKCPKGSKKCVKKAKESKKYKTCSRDKLYSSCRKQVKK